MTLDDPGGGDPGDPDDAGGAVIAGLHDEIIPDVVAALHRLQLLHRDTGAHPLLDESIGLLDGVARALRRVLGGLVGARVIDLRDASAPAHDAGPHPEGDRLEA